jgi:hypothetical protein
LLSPAAVITALTKIIPELQHKQKINDYQLLKVVTQAIPEWRPAPTSPEEVTRLWNLVHLMTRFTNTEPFRQDRLLFIETIEAWKNLLKTKSIRSLFKKEKENNTGIPTDNKPNKIHGDRLRMTMP